MANKTERDLAKLISIPRYFPGEECAIHMVVAAHKDVRPVVLKAGRFSSFEASERPGVYQQFFNDPELVITDLGYPWHGVALKEKA